MKKLITYITVTLNAEKYIEQCIKSVVSQKNQDVEYIILDGKSTDRTCSIIRKYKKYIDIFLSKKDKGMYHAMNNAINLAKGKYLCFINSDDWLEKNSTNYVLKYINQYKNIDIFYGDQKIFDKKKYLYTDIANHHHLSRYMSIPHQSTYINKDLFYNKKYSTLIKLSSDYDFFLYYYKKGSVFKKIPKILSSFRINGKSSNTYAMKNEFLKIQLKYNGLFFGYINFFFRYFKYYLKNIIK